MKSVVHVSLTCAGGNYLCNWIDHALGQEYIRIGDIDLHDRRSMRLGLCVAIILTLSVSSYFELVLSYKRCGKILIIDNNNNLSAL